MKSTSAPADTRMMAIVHNALERDLGRMRAALATQPYPHGSQRTALGAHALWLTDFLHAHHSGEDEGLWPLVRRRNPAAGPLLDQMDADHRRISPLMTALRDAAGAYAASTTDEPRAASLGALDELRAVLVPHLQREVAEMMPVVSASVTAGEWNAWDQEFNVKPKSLSQLGTEGHWLLDGIGPEGYQVVVHQVPAIPRFILVHGFARRYRRQAAARWQSAPVRALPPRPALTVGGDADGR